VARDDDAEQAAAHDLVVPPLPFEFFLRYIEPLVCLIGHRMGGVRAGFLFADLPRFECLFGALRPLAGYLGSVFLGVAVFTGFGSPLGSVRVFGFVLLALHFYRVFLGRSREGSRRGRRIARAAGRKEHAESEGQNPRPYPSESDILNACGCSVGWHRR
jgi:hypothetical protein